MAVRATRASSPQRAMPTRRASRRRAAFGEAALDLLGLLAEGRGLQLEVADLLGRTFEPDAGVELAFPGELDRVVELDRDLVRPLVGVVVVLVDLRAAGDEVRRASRGRVRADLAELAFAAPRRCPRWFARVCSSLLSRASRSAAPVMRRVGLVDAVGRAGELRLRGRAASRRRSARVGGDRGELLGQGRGAGARPRRRRSRSRRPTARAPRRRGSRAGRRRPRRG